ncbi:MAG: hypothetical protein J5898_00555 [Lachnospiraceae bacterium]|nr:hypothetical protein [Lachnospiraceae bacterium]
MLSKQVMALAETLRERDLYPDTVKVEYDDADLMLTDVALNAKRMREYLLAQPADVENAVHFCGHFHFDGSIMGDVFTRIGHPNFAKIRDRYYPGPTENLVTFEWQHSTANFAKVIDCGLRQHVAEIDRSLCRLARDERAADLLRAMRYTCETLILWAHRCADECEQAAAKITNEERRRELLTMAEILRHVPENPARTFRLP